MGIVSVSGKINSGKDTVGKIIQILTNSPHFTNKAVEEFLEKPILNPHWEIKKFADKLKDIVCLLLGCTREQLEDREFKDTPLGEEWECWENGFNQLYMTKEEAIDSAIDEWDADNTYVSKRILTPRLLMQLIGTECGRQILHPNIWVNALMSEYKSNLLNDGKFVTYKDPNGNTMSWVPHPLMEPETYPKWIITDTRFPNEIEAVEKRGGITIKVNRTYENPCKNISIDEHPSETALDNYEKFTYVIENNNTIEELIQKVREILTKEKLI